MGRDPIDRFVSGAGELMQRLVNGWCPRGPCNTTGHNGVGISDEEMAGYRADAMNSTLWYPRTQEPSFNWTTDVPELLGLFVQDVSCVHQCWADDHLKTQSAFGEVPERGIDVLMKLEDIEEGLDRLARKSGKSRRECQLQRLNTPEGKPTNVPSTHVMSAMVRANATLVRRLCKVLVQDYLCFDYEMPSECADMEAYYYTAAAANTRKQ